MGATGTARRAAIMERITKRHILLAITRDVRTLYSTATAVHDRPAPGPRRPRRAMTMTMLIIMQTLTL